MKDFEIEAFGKYFYYMIVSLKKQYRQPLTHIECRDWDTLTLAEKAPYLGLGKEVNQDFKITLADGLPF